MDIQREKIKNDYREGKITKEVYLQKQYEWEKIWRRSFWDGFYLYKDGKQVYIKYKSDSSSSLVKEDMEDENRDILENLIFDFKKFNNQDRLHQLKNLMNGIFSVDTFVLAKRDCKRIDPRVMNQFFCLYAAFYSLKLLSDDCVKTFVHQLALWFPQWVNEKNEKKVVKAIYDEQRGWKQNGVLVPCMEWQALISRSENMNSKKNRFRRITQEIYTNINQLVKTYK